MPVRDPLVAACRDTAKINADYIHQEALALSPVSAGISSIARARAMTVGMLVLNVQRVHRAEGWAKMCRGGGLNSRCFPDQRSQKEGA